MSFRNAALLNSSAVWLLSALILAVTLASLLAPHNPNEHHLARRYASPSSSHPIGTDQFGRDLLSRMLYGGRISIGLGFSVTAVSLAFGAIIGALSGYLGGKLDAVLMRLVDFLLAFPLIYLAATSVALFGASLSTIFSTAAAVAWMDIARIVRAEVLSIKQRDFIKAAQGLGFSHARVILRHLLPNLLPSISAVAVLRVADVILLESGLSFLGLGVQPPMASWGAIIRDGRDVLDKAWWIATFPGAAIAITVLSLNGVANALRRRMKRG